jgi:hypothetical protein
LKVAGEDLLKILPAIDQVSGQVNKPCPSCVINGEKLDDEEVVIHLTRLAGKAVVLQPNARIGFAVILDDVVWRLKALREAHVSHIALEHLGPRPFGAEAVPFSNIVLAAVLGTRPLIPR